MIDTKTALLATACVAVGGVWGFAGGFLAGRVAAPEPESRAPGPATAGPAPAEAVAPGPTPPSPPKAPGLKAIGPDAIQRELLGAKKTEVRYRLGTPTKIYDDPFISATVLHDSSWVYGEDGFVVHFNEGRVVQVVPAKK